MLFTTAAFVCLFLPLSLALFFGLGRWRPHWAAGALFAASVAFYGVWMPMYVLLLLGSILGNFLLGRAIATARAREARAAAKRWMVLGVCANLGLLAYYKYANFFIDNLNALTGQHWHLAPVLLPIGISFFSFTQIAFLADSYQKGVKELRFRPYGLFVS